MVVGYLIDKKKVRFSSIPGYNLIRVSNVYFFIKILLPDLIQIPNHTSQMFEHKFKKLWK